MIHVGPAGWSYADWDGRVYPRPRSASFHGLPYLAEFFGCVEVNSTFYALPRAATVSRWVQLVRPWPGFRFVVKLSQAFSHEPCPEDGAVWAELAERPRLQQTPLTKNTTGTCWRTLWRTRTARVSVQDVVVEVLDHLGHRRVV